MLAISKSSAFPEKTTKSGINKWNRMKRQRRISKGVREGNAVPVCSPLPHYRWASKKEKSSNRTKIGQGLKDEGNLGYLKETYLGIMTRQQWDGTAGEELIARQIKGGGGEEVPRHQWDSFHQKSVMKILLNSFVWASEGLSQLSSECGRVFLPLL